MDTKKTLVDIYGREEVFNMLIKAYKLLKYTEEDAIDEANAHMFGIEDIPFWRYESLISPYGDVQILYDYSMFDLVFILKDNKLISIITVYEVVDITTEWEEDRITVLGREELVSLNLRDMSYKFTHGSDVA